ncbi:Oidioi.mRNA.OKI2018_I69.XSR.g13332.t1.cds [Oikopleura dioica]|uniref:Oidioi.mRNA.OKI2018_I69.XSR.g13332.t1.cds n=1 Tax=Oikopleura dioica TaxID=34765 RepID=A0ABN7SBA2_OIKDI|nr:Oidioi.mRNA.OKI2018_I69.XSR.g13332.t1.cds [Oikopleura dioica]
MSNSKILLYGYPASSATWRVRAAMIYKKVDFEEKMIDINVGDAGFTAKVNPMGFVPAVKFPQNEEALLNRSRSWSFLINSIPSSRFYPRIHFNEPGKSFPFDPLISVSLVMICLYSNLLS